MQIAHRPRIPFVFRVRFADLFLSPFLFLCADKAVVESRRDFKIELKLFMESSNELNTSSLFMTARKAICLELYFRVCASILADEKSQLPNFINMVIRLCNERVL